MSATRTEWIKAPAAVLDYKVDWSSWLAQGETISSKTVTVTGPDALLVVNSSTLASTSVTAWLSGGTAGFRYRVNFHVVTSGSRTDERSITIAVQDR